MTFSASFTKKLMDIKANPKCKQSVSYNSNGGYVNNLCIDCAAANHRGDNLSESLLQLQNCNCLQTAFPECFETRSSQQEQPSIAEECGKLQTAKFLKILTLKKRKHRGQYCSPHHKHLYKNYMFTNLNSLKKYFKEFKMNSEYDILRDNLEYKCVIDNFWNCYVVDTSCDGSSMNLFRKLVYQTSPYNRHDIDLTWRNKFLEQDFWQIYQNDSVCFHNWIYKLRLWLSATILDRIVQEIDRVNLDLKKLGLIHISVGTTGLHVLENLSNSILVTSQIPNLPLLITFLEISIYQNYVVQRIKELASGGCMDDYRWNSGGMFNNQPWRPHLPSDAKLIMHLLCTYLDFHVPLFCNTNLKPFTTKYFTNDTTSMAGKSKICIVESSTMPSHYKIFMNGRLVELPSGSNNVFYAILVLMKYILNNESGMLDGISLGKNGLNLLWIFTASNSHFAK
ncbi:transmembrane protein 209-like [Rhodnius prolixus]|uniref:transmembrane protein 209-like n=1 Tax=Rhodnius prolixus TaxID=13249 RepID=UPI003D188AD1